MIRFMIDPRFLAAVERYRRRQLDQAVRNVTSITDRRVVAYHAEYAAVNAAYYAYASPEHAWSNCHACLPIIARIRAEFARLAGENA